jgi:hypothetical protein
MIQKIGLIFAFAVVATSFTLSVLVVLAFGIAFSYA